MLVFRRWLVLAGHRRKWTAAQIGGRGPRRASSIKLRPCIPGVDTFVAQGARLSRPDRGRLNRHSELAICTYAHNFRLRVMYICA
ncbi:hypothetical protein DM450_24205 (plasmid) [Sphingomonas sp. IC081]|nr:hypothetical protein [Sphingobium sp.]QDK35829.1 hypothetical protein DM450_24205 [Sphingomonas sp. IC081]